MKRSRLALSLSTGLAMFSMFFGSGNLVFPVLAGQQSQGHYLLAALGIVLTGVCVPFLGSLGMLLFQGKPDDFFCVLGKKASFIVCMLILSLLGPFAVVARCITVAHGSFTHLFPSVSLPLFSAFFCFITFLSILKKNQLVSLLGNILTPILLGSLFLIAYFGLDYNLLPESSSLQVKVLTQGLLTGYQTMDLLAAFFFSTFIFNHLKRAEPALASSPWQCVKLSLGSSLIGMGLLALIYLLLVMLGATHAEFLNTVAPEQMLANIAEKTLGYKGSIIVCMAILLACFTTASVLTTLFADFFRQRVFQNRLSFTWAAFFSLLIAFAISTLEFSGIARFITPIIEIIYPALIVLTLLNLSKQLIGTPVPRWPIVLALFVRVIVH